MSEVSVLPAQAPDTRVRMAERLWDTTEVLGISKVMAGVHREMTPGREAEQQGLRPAGRRGEAVFSRGPGDGARMCFPARQPSGTATGGGVS